MSFSAEKQKAKQQQHIDINHSDLTDRTGHWIENQCLKYLKLKKEKEKVHRLVCVDACAQNL